MTKQLQKKVIGVGSPIIDLLAEVEDEFVSMHAGNKGGMELMEDADLKNLVKKLDKEPVLAAGGSAANTIFALARLEADASFLGKLGNDEFAKQYLREFEELKGDTSRFKFSDDMSTARCLSMVTRDYERTMRTCLGAAATMEIEDIEEDDFKGFDYAHFEGYLLFNKELITEALKKAKHAGCKISLDLGSFEVVKTAGKDLYGLLEEYVDIVFANEDEARAFTGDEDLGEALEELSGLCEIAAVKLGADGAMLKNKHNKVIVEAEKVETVVDTTGAGDYWAAGFLFGLINDLPLEDCGKLGAVIGAEVVQQLGADLPEENWQKLLEKFKARTEK